MDSSLAIALAALAVAAASFFFGSGLFWRGMRAARALEQDEMDKRYLTLKDFAVHEKAEAEWRAHMAERVVEPLEQGLRTLHSLVVAVEVSTQAIRHMGEEMRDVRDEVKELRRDRRPS